MSKDKINSKHHYLPKMYLDGFTESELVGTWTREDGKYRAKKTREVANIRGFYTFTNKGGVKSGELEEAFAHMESQVGVMIRNINCLFPPQFNASYRLGLSEYISLQYLRTPEKRKSVEQIYDLAAKMQGRYLLRSKSEIKEALKESGSDHSDEAVKQVQDYFSQEPHSLQIVPSKEEVMRLQLSRAWPLLSDNLLAREWHLITFDSPSLITSDSPIQLVSTHNEQRGFLTADELWFPLSSTRLLIIALPEYRKERMIRGDYILAQKANELQIGASYLEAFGPPSLLEKFSGLALGRRPLTKIRAGFDKDFFEHYNKPPENPRPVNR